MSRFVPGQLLTGPIYGPIQVLGADSWGGSLSEDAWFVVAVLRKKGSMSSFVLLHSQTCRLVVTDDGWIGSLTPV